MRHSTFSRVPDNEVTGLPPIVGRHPVALFLRPSPDVTEELFLLDGARKGAAVFVALPSMAEHREAEVWGTLARALLTEDAEDVPAAAGGATRPYRGLASFG